MFVSRLLSWITTAVGSPGVKYWAMIALTQRTTWCYSVDTWGLLGAERRACSTNSIISVTIMVVGLYKVWKYCVWMIFGHENQKFGQCRMKRAVIWMMIIRDFLMTVSKQNGLMMSDGKMCLDNGLERIWKVGLLYNHWRSIQLKTILLLLEWN
jgi:hypothetical protein